MEDDEHADELPGESKKVVIGLSEEARAIEHQVTHMPTTFHYEVCARAKAQHTSKEKMAVVIDPDAVGPNIPERFGAQITADRLTKNDDGEEDDGIPIETFAVVLLDRGTGWIDVYPEGSNSTEPTVEASQHYAGAKDKDASFLL